MKSWLFALLSIYSLSLSAATINAIKYDGMVHISEAVANHLLTFKAGDAYDPVKINEAIKSFYAQGYFNDIWVTEEAGVITFHFKEKSIISKVEMKGWKEDDEDVKKNLLQIKKGSLYDTKRIDAAKARIIESLNQEGKIDTVVEVETEYLESGSVGLTFIVNEGENIVIEKLAYDGVEGVDPELFDEMIANKEHEFMGWFWGRNDGKMKLSELQYDPLRIRDIYMQYGYLDAKIDEPFARVDFDHYTSQMSYQVTEGEVYRVSNIHIAQETEVISDQRLRETIKLTLNEPFNIKTFREDSERVKTAIADLGYAFVQVVPDLRKDEKGKTVDVVYRIRPGKKVWIRNVIISGNNRTLDRIVRRELYLGPGDLYNLTDLKDSRNALGRTGYFESQTVEEKRVDEQTVDLIVKTKEAPTGNIQIGGGYGSYGGILLSVGVSDRNIWGTGINVGLNLENSQLTKNYSFNVSNARLNDSDFSGNLSLYYSDIKYNDYAVGTTGVSVGTGHRISRHLTAYLGYGYSSVDYTDLSTFRDSNGNDLVIYDDRIFQSYNKSSLTASLTYDSTDDFYLPREGIVASQSLEWAGEPLGADARFWKSRTTFNVYQGLQEWLGMDIIARYKSRFFFVEDEGFLPLNERFFMGGIRSVRGYESYSLPVVYINGAEFRTGAKQTFSNNVELSFPLVPKAKMRLSTFVDWGWIPGEEGTLSDGSEWAFSDVSRGGYGIGLEWFSPVGPVQLVFANALNAAPTDKTSFFEFTIGQRF